MNCSCEQECDYTDEIILYLLIAGLNDQEIQEELLTFEDLNIEKAEQKAVAKEAAKYSQSEMTGDKVNRLKSSYAKKKSAGPMKSGHDNSRKCKFCGGPWHESREAECKAYDATCNACGKKGHFKIVCRSKKLTTLEASKEETKSESGDCLYDSNGSSPSGCFNQEYARPYF